MNVLGPAVAGTWYPAERTTLAELVDRLLAAADRPSAEPLPRVAALIAPHAGFVYSGAVAAEAFRHLADRARERVVLIGPSHHRAYPGGAVPAASAYRTPLGPVELDAEALVRLGGAAGMRVDDAPFVPEHSLEAEIPFLQRTLRPGWRLVPVLIGAGSRPDDILEVADALRSIVDPGTLVVVSSDFTHFGPRFDYVPFTDDVPRRIRELDTRAIDTILACDATAFERVVSETAATICGRSAISVLLRLLPPDSPGVLAAYDTSGALTGSWDHSVSYAGVVFGAPEAGR